MRGYQIGLIREFSAPKVSTMRERLRSERSQQHVRTHYSREHSQSPAARKAGAIVRQQI